MSGSPHKPGSHISVENYRDFVIYKRLESLREEGLNEMFFSLNDPRQQIEYMELLAELQFYRMPFEKVELREGVAFVFLTEEVARDIGIEGRRNHLQRTLGKRV